MRRALVIALCFLPTFALGGRYIRSPGGSVGDRVDALAAMAMPRTLSEIRTRLDSARMARAIDPGELFLCRIPGHDTYLVTKRTDGTVVSFKDHADETDPVFVAWKPATVVTGAGDSTIATTGTTYNKKLKIKLSTANTWTAAQTFSGGAIWSIPTYDNGGVPNPPNDAALNTAFPSATAGWSGPAQDANDGKIYWVTKKATNDWWYVLMTAG